jgi:transposase
LYQPDDQPKQHVPAFNTGKKVSGIKRHLFVDNQGLPHAIAITTTNVTDREGALIAMKQQTESLSNVLVILADGSYPGEAFAADVQQLINASVRIAKRSELHTFKVIPDRWVVERSFAWLEKNRRLWKNTERLLNTSLQFVVLAFLALLLRR